jgi:bifunctional DNA-binding transcriptional regulator/antitoxin component of YhaV-PrlF toxin-antitoxin module
MASGIDWSVPVRIKAVDGGGLQVEIPEKAIKGLGISEGDVLCFTGFENGTVEVWPVKKGTYSSLDDAGAAQQAMESAKKENG